MKTRILKLPVVTAGVALLVAAIAVALFFYTERDTVGGAEAACNLMDTPFDMVAVGTGQDGQMRIQESRSGRDIRTEVTMTDPDGALIGKYETIVVERTRYYRETLFDDPSRYGEWRIVDTNAPLTVPLPCLDTSTFEEGATGLAEPHYTRARYLSEEEGEVREEFWADSNGRPTRATRTFYPPDEEGASGASENATMTFTYSGYGDPNTITAPTVVNPDHCGKPFPNQRVTNPTLQMKREPFTHATQSWDPHCVSSHAPTHNAQFYTFVNHDVSDVNGETVLATMRVNIKMTTRHDDVSLLLLGAQFLEGLEPDAPIVATAEPVDAEAGALRTLEIEKVVPYGSYSIEVRARNPGDATFDLTAAHVEEPGPPAFEQDSYTFSVAEDAGRFKSVGTVSATDPRDGAITYRITSGAAGKFDIDANEGIIVVRAGLDYETTPTYTLTVEARNPKGLTDTATVTINVTDVAGK